MEHVHDLTEIQLPGSELTIGSFDGVHLGHQQLVRELVDHARAARRPAVVLTFFPHPSVVLRGRKPSFYISSPEEKAQLLGDLGVDYVITQTFDLALSRVSASDFLGRLQASLGMRSLWIGEDFALGHNREGNRAYLEEQSGERDFELHVVAPYKVQGEIVSSTRVREALRSGAVSQVEAYLGRPFKLPGEVVRGAGRGHDLGFPTANLAIWDERAYPRSGVYACLADLEGERASAVTNIGHRPTFEDDGGPPTIEAHLLDYSGELYGKKINLEFLARLRAERRFPNPQALMKQITLDIQQAREIIAERREEDHA
ncbi:MAG: bifunctional riboflavin kinase/FAD synthetase [Anaerolineales bacterium]|jgi:riboflavin kinase/FMN adenylyltransferase